MQKNAKKGDAESVIKTVDKFCWDGKWMMHIGDVKGKILDDAVKKHKPMKVLELGTYCGYSSVRIGRLMGEGSKLVSLDVNEKWQNIGRQVGEFAGLKGKVEYWLGKLTVNAERLKKELG